MAHQDSRDSYCALSMAHENYYVWGQNVMLGPNRYAGGQNVMLGVRPLCWGSKRYAGGQTVMLGVKTLWHGRERLLSLMSDIDNFKTFPHYLHWIDYHRVIVIQYYFSERNLMN